MRARLVRRGRSSVGSRFRSCHFLGHLLLSSASVVALTPAHAQETITYTYDARGRLVKVDHGATGPNANVVASYSYDAADNRCNVTVSTTGASGTGTCGTPTPTPTPTCSGVSFSVANASANEGTNLSFKITKTGSTTDSCSISYATADGTAKAGTNYTAKSGSLSFLSSALSKTVAVVTQDDGVVTGALTMSLNLSAASGAATISDAQGVGTINNIDTPPTCTGVTFTIASNGAVTEGTSSVFTITKHGTATGSCNVNYATANGTAAAPGDFTAKSGTLTFTSAQTSQTVAVTTIDDTVVESAETFSMTLSAPTGGAALGTPSSATATINDNDGTTVQPPTPVNDTGSQGICTTNTYNVTANDTDPGGNLPLSVTAVSGVGFALVTGDPTSVQFSSTTSTGNKVGTYTVQNTKGATATATLTVSVIGGGVCP